MKTKNEKISYRFDEIIKTIPLYIDKWCKTNSKLKENKIPRYYSEIELLTDLGHVNLKIKLIRTRTGSAAYYNDINSITDTFKRCVVIIEHKQKPIAYDVTGRYVAKEGRYVPLKMDINRINNLDDKHNALPWFNNTMLGKILNSVPMHQDKPYPKSLYFRIK